jgi:hypothetical protein
MSRAAVTLCLLLGLTLSGDAQPTDGWRTFGGSWSATGQQETIPTEGARAAAVIRLSGSLVLTDETDSVEDSVARALAFDDTLRLAWGARCGPMTMAIGSSASSRRAARNRTALDRDDHRRLRPLRKHLGRIRAVLAIRDSH